MPTTLTGGIDVLGIAGPLIDTAFTLAGTYRITVTLQIGGTQSINVANDAATKAGMVSITVPAIPTKKRNDEGQDVTANDQTLFINASDIAAACAAMNPPIPVPEISTNDTVLIGNQKWNIFANETPAGTPTQALIVELRIRQ